MKIANITKGLLAFGLALPFSGAVGCESEEPTTGDEQDATATIDDAFAKVVLTGGCSVKIASTGKTVKTKGTKGVCPTTVQGMVDHLKTINEPGIKVFSVSEGHDIDPANADFRFVVSFTSKDNPGEDIFLSVLGSAAGVSQGFMEAMGFSAKKGAYVYYHVVDGKWEQAGHGGMVPADAAPGTAVAFECQNCHTNGHPLMKELHDSWTNWSSTWMGFTMPQSSDATFQFFASKLTRADDLEELILPATKKSVAGRIDRAIKKKELGQVYRNALCDVGEPSLIAVHSKSSKRLGDVSTFSSMLPGAILISQLFAAPRTGTGVEEGLDATLAMNLPDFGGIGAKSDSYVKAVKKLGVTFEGMSGTNDGFFAWTSPEKSHADIETVQELLRRNLVDKDVVADTMMVDFTVPMFSNERCALAETLPETWSSPDELKTAWAANLAGSTLRGAKGLATRLAKKDDFATHEAAVNGFLKACNARNAASADQYAEDVLKIVAQRRNEFRDHYASVVESPLLLPIDKANDTAPGTWRLSGDKCELQKRSAKFVGEE